jgi:hypothetical protein
MLNGFYTSLIHDNQVLILEALERLEQDYKGGHREESIASLERITSPTAEDEDEEDEAAWTQILRDLEDVGVARQDALSYRDMIIDWLLQAVNEGRLLEQRIEPAVPATFLSLPNDLEDALPEFDTLEMPGTHHFDVPAVFPSYKTSHLTPSWSSSPTTAFAVPYHQRAQSVLKWKARRPMLHRSLPRQIHRRFMLDQNLNLNLLWLRAHPRLISTSDAFLFRVSL